MQNQVSDEKERKPMAIFLDIDGVLLGHKYINEENCEDVKQKVKELFPNIEEHNSVHFKTAATYFFPEKVTSRFQKFIEDLVEEYGSVIIIISSTWRVHATIKEMKEVVFARFPWSKYIVDRTVDKWFYMNGKKETVDSIACYIKYGFRLKSRADEVAYWLGENWENYRIRSFVIFDDLDDEYPWYNFSNRFPKNFIKIDPEKLLRSSHLKKAKKILEKKWSRGINIKNKVILYNPQESKNLSILTHQHRTCRRQ